MRRRAGRGRTAALLAALAAGGTAAAQGVAAQGVAAQGVAAQGAAATAGVAYEGSDRAVVRLAPELAARVEEHTNAGYRLRRGSAAGEVTVEVSLAPLDSRSPFTLPDPAANEGVRGAAAAGEVARAARSAAAGAATVYAAVSGVLGWIVHNVSAAEDEAGGGRAPAAVLASGTGDAADVARLAVALLGALGIEARTVHGLVVGPPRPGAPRGAHAWIEVRYPDRGWAFSDPLHHHHYVPATYLRLAGAASALAAAELVAREDRRAPVDVYAAGGPGVGARRNDETQVAAALRVVVPGAAEGVAVLTAAGGTAQRRALRGGEGVFVGLDGGAYTLEVLIPGQPRLARSIELAPRQRSAVLFGGEAAAESAPGAAPAPPPPVRQRPGQARRTPR